jgi:glucans biosynthesis protein
MRHDTLYQAGVLSCALSLIVVRAAYAGAPIAPHIAPAPAATSAPIASAYAFSFDALMADAKRRSGIAYTPQHANVPSALDKLSPEQYREIHFNPDAGIWRKELLPFRLELLRAKLDQQTNVIVSTLDDGIAHDLVATPDMFQMGSTLPAQLGKASLPLSGFRVRARINSKKIWDEFLVFQGASYFRGVAQNLVYGLSARGLAIDTAEPSGEEFPEFTHFWIERPAPNSADIVILALLESPSTTGAYQFKVHPGPVTSMDVDLTLYPRSEMRMIGIAPLTSMFLFDETNRGLLDDYRPEVHDSDGLQMTTQSGEQIWRQLANPTKLQVSAFTSQAPKGFGLAQRSREQSDYQDFNAQYERRPSSWVEPQGDWGPGAVELVEIPSGRETNDNIVAFWRPTRTFQPGHSAHFAYRMSWLAEPALLKSLGKAVATHSGASLDGKRRVFVLDFAGAGEKIEGLRLDLNGSAGKISNATLVSNSAIHGLRANFEIDPKGADLVELRLRIMRGDSAVTETWLYRWTAN